MVDWTVIKRLMKCFPGSFINQNGELIVHKKANEYLILHNCETELDLKCKVLEWFSRGAYKTAPFGTKRKNDEFHKFMRDGINEFLGTKFTEEDMDLIYTYLGNRCNHAKTVQFICRDYDFSVLLKEANKE